MNGDFRINRKNLVGTAQRHTHTLGDSPLCAFSHWSSHTGSCERSIKILALQKVRL